MGSFNPFVNIHKRPMVLSGNRQLVSEGVRALEALTEEALLKLYPAVEEDYDDEVLVYQNEIDICEIEIWENMPIRCLLAVDMINEWITWTGSKWIREEDAS